MTEFHTHFGIIHYQKMLLYMAECKRYFTQTFDVDILSWRGWCGQLFIKNPKWVQGSSDLSYHPIFNDRWCHSPQIVINFDIICNTEGISSNLPVDVTVFAFTALTSLTGLWPNLQRACSSIRPYAAVISCRMWFRVVFPLLLLHKISPGGR